MLKVVLVPGGGGGCLSNKCSNLMTVNLNTGYCCVVGKTYLYEFIIHR